MALSESVYAPAEYFSPEKAKEACRADCQKKLEFLADEVLPKISEVELNTGGSLAFVTLPNYQPVTTKDALPVPASFLKADVDEFLNQNIEKSDIGEVRRFVNNFLVTDAGEKLLLDLGIEADSLGNLTPQQAIKLSNSIVACHLEYDSALAEKPIRDDLDVEIFRRTGRIESSWSNPLGRVSPDAMGVTALMENGLGVCRNYAEASIVIFQMLKDSQDPRTSQLVNTYLRATDEDESMPEKAGVDKAIRNIMYGHVWLEGFTVEPGGSIVSVITDPTFLDGGGVEAEDQTKARYAMSLGRMLKDGVITDKAFLEGLRGGGDLESLPRGTLGVLGECYLEMGDKKLAYECFTRTYYIFKLPKETVESLMSEKKSLSDLKRGSQNPGLIWSAFHNKDFRAMRDLCLLPQSRERSETFDALSSISLIETGEAPSREDIDIARRVISRASGFLQSEFPSYYQRILELADRKII